MAHITGMYRPRPDTVYMETVYPVLRQVVLNLIVLASHLDNDMEANGTYI